MDDYLRYSLQRLSRPDELPQELKPDKKLPEAAGLALGYALSLADKASPETRTWVKERLEGTVTPPTATAGASQAALAWGECDADYSWLDYRFDCRHTISTTPPIQVHYNIQGVSGYWQQVKGESIWVALPGLPAVDQDGDKIPDAANTMSASLITASQKYRNWGYQVTGSVIDVYVGVDTFDNPGVTFQTGDMFNDHPIILMSHDPGASAGTSDWYTYLPRHELFHAFQYHYMSNWHFVAAVHEINWWMEATAEWATHQVYEQTGPTDAGSRQYARNVTAFLGKPQDAVNANDGLGGSRQYGAFVLAQYLIERTDFNFVLRTWQEMADRYPITAISNVLRGYGRDPSTELLGFAVANYRLTSPSSALSEFVGADDGYQDDDAYLAWQGILGRAGYGSRPARASEKSMVWGSSASFSPLNTDLWLRPGGTQYYDFTPGGSGQGQLKVHVNAPDQHGTDSAAEFHYLLVVWDNLTSRNPLRWDRADAKGNDDPAEHDLSVPIKGGEVATLIVTRTDLSESAAVTIAQLQPVMWTASLTSGIVTTPAGPDTALNAMWARHADRTGYDTMCANWSGADGTQSVLLPSGRRAWFFSDTYLGDGALRPTFDKSILRNSIVVQDGANPATASLRTVTGGNTCRERDTSIPNAADRYAYSPVRSTTTGNDPAGEYYWSATGKVLGDNVVWFYLKGRNLEFLNSSMAIIPVSRLDSSSVVNVVPVDLPKHSYYGSNNPIIWGSSVVDDPDGKTYIYGWAVVDSSNRKKPFLARVPKAQLTDFNAWRFYKGSGQWTSDGGATGQAQAVPLNSAYTDPMYSVITLNGRYWLVTLDPTTHAMVAYPSTTRWGFSTSRVTLYTPPENVGQAPEFKLIYDLHVHKGLSTSGDSVVISYNVNSTGVNIGCRPEIDYVPKIYRARFVDVPTASFDPTAARAPVAPRTQAGTSGAEALSNGPADDVRAGRGVRIPPPPTGQPAAPAAAADSGPKIVTKAATVAADNGYYNSWDYQSDADRQKDHAGCPYIPAPTGLTGKIVNTAWGWVELNWNAVGPDVGYKIYEYNVTEKAKRKWPWDWSFGPPRTIGPLDAYPGDRGDVYEWYLVPVNIWQQNETSMSNKFQLRLPL
ncbi:hypothetical protein AB0O28_22610 [Microbispora sp. NPDC088329]|uniref:hypothetical protein n=1 Tax=Microbispora sp. NPDC088329 TaxID=3154869 RepID=UPI00341B311C